MRIIIPGEPIGKQNRVQSPRGYSYYPEKTATWLAYATDIIAMNWKWPRIEQPVKLTILAVCPRPKKYRRNKDPDGRMFCPVKPDFDNISKAFSDAMTKAGAWRDDCLVVDGRIVCLYEAKKDDHPQIIADVEIVDWLPEPGRDTW